jgi:hypothetical protein
LSLAIAWIICFTPVRQIIIGAFFVKFSLPDNLLKKLRMSSSPRLKGKPAVCQTLLQRTLI